MKSSVFIATPSYSAEFCAAHVSALFETGVLLSAAGYGLYHSVCPGNPFLDLARNDLVDRFLETDAEDLLFIDDDVGWDAKTVTRVLSHSEEVVGGLVPKRDATRDDSYHQNAITGVISAGGLFQTLELPTAFMRIKRSVFAKLKKPYFKIGHADGFGEDIYFCRRWVETGNFCWIDADMTFTHHGKKAWKGNFFDHAVSSGIYTQQEAA